MLFEDPKTQELLRRIIGKLTRDSALREDLIQEGLIYLWRSEVQRPAQTLSWYLQGCQFHLHNYLTIGRSVDAEKRRQNLVTALDEGENETEINDPLLSMELDCLVVEEVSARDVLHRLSKKLSPRAKIVLAWLHDGFGVCEIARELRMSYKTVMKLRRKIASEAIKFGLVPLPRPERLRSPSKNRFAS